MPFVRPTAKVWMLATRRQYNLFRQVSTHTDVCIVDLPFQPRLQVHIVFVSTSSWKRMSLAQRHIRSGWIVSNYASSLIWNGPRSCERRAPTIGDSGPDPVITPRRINIWLCFDNNVISLTNSDEDTISLILDYRN